MEPRVYKVTRPLQQIFLLQRFFIYASSEPKSVPAQDLGDCRDNLRNSRSVFLIVYRKDDLMESIYDCFKLNNDMKIPCVGFGTYKAAEENNVEILKTAIEAGYRYFDTASFYQTEDFVGQAIRESNLPREDFFLVSKMWKDEMGYQQTKDALEKSLKRLGTDYLDIYLIHWPRPSADCENWKELDLETWRAMEELQKEGKIRGLGLSNFLPHHIKNILENGTVKPVVNQLELHPGYMQQAAVQYCKEHGIQMQAWSPIGRRRILEDGLILELAGKYQVSPAQLCLRFLLQNDIIPLPKSSSMERMKQNMDLFHFEISEEDVSRLATMPQAGWSGEHPDPELAQKNVV